MTEETDSFFQKITRFLNKSKQSWKEIIISTIVLTLILTIFWEYFLHPQLDNLIYSISEKPEIIVSVNRVVLTRPDEPLYLSNVSNLTENMQIYFLSCCNTREMETSVKVFNSNPNSEKIPRSFTNEKCRFDDGEDCYFYTINIANVGKAKAKSIIVDGSILSDRVEFSQHSPKIKLETGTGFFGTGGFYFEINDLDINEELGLLIKARSLSDVKLTCEANGKKDLCFYKVYNMYLTDIVKPTGMIINEKKVYFPTISWEPKFYQFVPSGQSYVWQEKTSDAYNDLKLKCNCKY
ncbi:Uncharacterised protein [uncultured archaeon]|nr:Uncharacterised protein [uncultured archaeon]